MDMFRKLTALLVAMMILVASLLAFAAAETEAGDSEEEAPRQEEGEMERGGPEDMMKDGEAPEGMPEDGEFPEDGETPEDDAQPEEDDSSATAVQYVEFDGTVVSGVSRAVTTSVGGTVESVAVRAGQKVEAGDVLATLRTEKVYATQDGTVSAVFGAAGDSVDVVAERYGAVLYIEPSEGRYTISADTTNAYSSSDNLYIHVGETVYLKCYSDGTHTGVGFVSGVSGDSYTVEVTEGTFKVGETVTVFRGSDYASSTRLGRGECQRADDVAVGGSASGGASANGSTSASSSIVAMHVAAGDAVQKGDLLYETLSGAYDAYYCTGSDVIASASGILGELNCDVGDGLSSGARVATIYPTGDMQLEIDVNEADLPYIHEGDAVTIRFNWDDGEAVYEGVVFSISYVAGSQQGSQETGSSSDDAVYTAYVSFEPDENVRLGMTATAAVMIQ
ncbi:MAG: HlyD family efflux transporter periplasmic adaptor subunit [Clostridia bacterium]|nr:HlyD family efflux transporter periplasmic adaptor subunit [Clostridia bacterium]